MARCGRLLPGPRRYLRRVIDLPRTRRALESYVPRLVPDAGRPLAAVAMVLTERDGRPEVLLIERAKREGDPWSGHMAFPGGRVEREDPGVREAAERETFEEVGIALDRAELLGRLDDLEGLTGRTPPLVISAFVYFHAAPGPIAPSPEVEQALWVPLDALVDPERRVDLAYPAAAGSSLYPGIRVGHPERHIVWGLTYRFVEIFFRALERPLPDRWPASR